MEFNAYSMLVDFMWAGIFLFVAKMLREKIKILQSLFVPVSLLAGFIGLALGQNGFGIISFSSQFGSYAGLLIIAVFVSIGLRGFNFSAGGWKTNFDRIGSYYCFRNIGWAFQYAMPIIFAMVVLKIVAPDLNPAFGMLIPAGFQGGHGTAAALGATLGTLWMGRCNGSGDDKCNGGYFNRYFWWNYFDQTWNKKKRNYTKFVKDFSQLPNDMRTGLIEEEKNARY